MHDLNGALFLSQKSFCSISVFEVVLTFILPFTTKYMSLESHKSDPSIEVLNLIFLLTEYWPIDKSFTLTHSLVTNFDTDELFNNLDIL